MPLYIYTFVPLYLCTFKHAWHPAFIPSYLYTFIPVYCRPGCRVLPYPGCVVSTWPPTGYLSRKHQISTCLQDPQKSEKVCQRSPKVTKKVHETGPQDTNLMKKRKKWNHSKTSLFPMFIAHTAMAFWHHFHPWVTKNMALETVSHFGLPNRRKIT